MVRVLVADDEPNLRKSLAEWLETEGMEPVLAADGEEARALLGVETVDALVLDLRMPRLDGLGLLRWLRDSGPASIPALVVSAHGDVKDAVEAMKLGARDYLVKPFDPDELVLKIRAAVQERRLAADLEAGARGAIARDEMVGESPAIKEAERLIAKAAPTGATVLLVGESGTGKEVAARLVHRLSGRSGPFVPVNLGAVPESLAESELFGHEKGAFTGADARRQGLFELAKGGTLFLDEIGELPLQLQVKLLRVLQERVVTRIGGAQAIPVDVRIVAATNRDLEAEVKAGRFREDLFYRVNVVRVRMPPLRERSGDVALLAGHFLGKLSAETGKRVRSISPRALVLLAGHSFPGNVRELSNAIERAVILADGEELEPRDFEFFAPSEPRAGQAETAARGGASADPFAEPVTIAELERRAIRAALERNEGRREKSAGELGISRRTLLNKIKEYGLGES